MHATQEQLFFPHPKIHYIFQGSGTQFYKMLHGYIAVLIQIQCLNTLVLFSTGLFQSILFINFE